MRRLSAKSSIITPTADSAKLRARDDCLNRYAESVVIILKLLLQFRQKNFIGQLNFPAESEAEQLSAELSYHILFSFGEQVLAQTGQSIDLFSAEQRRLCIDFLCSYSTENIELLEGKAVRIDASVAL